MAKRRGSLTGNKPKSPRSKKTRKRLEAKAKMLEEKAAKKRR